MKVLIATDGSDFAQAALESVSGRPWTEDTSFMVLHVVQPFAPAYVGFNLGYAEALAIIDDAGRESGQKIVSDAVDLLKQKLPDRSITGQMKNGQIVDEIIDTAKQWKADMIVMGSHGRSGIAKFFMGSIAEAVLSRAPCSVEIIRRVHSAIPPEDARLKILS